ncbi:right-handed parallel beta-helix repeat-containing protein [Candidatus Uhrbacteria bacterium]|nr:right-handed parallel beta-helix repeat-containing protein [Candidatus Uhrbacteria bacterium]
MTTRRKIIFSILGILILAIAITAWLFLRTTIVADTTRSGVYFGNQIWSGDILVTGDVMVLGNLTVREGTRVRFAVGDDRGWGDEVPADGYNDHDPTRLLSYGKTHSLLFILRRFIAIGTAERPITFTSAAEHPTYADWEAIIFEGNGSIVDHAVVEYSRNGLNPIGDQRKSVIRDSIVRHTLWGAISSSHSTIPVIHNHLYDCGHEGIDVQSDQVIRDNRIEDCHAGIVVLKGSPTIERNTMKGVSDGIGVDPEATPKMSDNTITLADPSADHPYTYQNFSYHLFGDPTW